MVPVPRGRGPGPAPQLGRGPPDGVQQQPEIQQVRNVGRDVEQRPGGSGTRSTDAGEWVVVAVDAGR